MPSANAEPKAGFAKAPSIPVSAYRGGLGTALGLFLSSVVLATTVWLIAQHLRHRPLDLSKNTARIGEVAADVLEREGVPGELISITLPVLVRTPRAYFYYTTVEAHLPSAVVPDEVIDGLERGLLQERIVISSEQNAETERVAFLSVGGVEIGEVRLHQAQNRRDSHEAPSARPQHQESPPVENRAQESSFDSPPVQTTQVDALELFR